MVKQSSQQLDLIFKALSDPTRREILRRLAQEESSVTELAAPFDMSLAAVSKHLKVLEAAQIITKTKDGRNFRCRADLTPLTGVSELLEDLGLFWRAQLNSLEKFLSVQNTKNGEKSGRRKRK